MGTVQRISGHFGRDALGYYAALLRFMRGRGRFFLYHYTGFGFAALIVTGDGTRYTAFMGRTHGWKADQIATNIGLTVVASGSVGRLVACLAVSASYRRGNPFA